MLCIAAVALIAGLFLGYLTLDAFDLRIIQRASVNLEERVWAETILPIVVERHRVLVTLLILNGLAYETCELNAYFCVSLLAILLLWPCCIIKIVVHTHIGSRFFATHSANLSRQTGSILDGDFIECDADHDLWRNHSKWNLYGSPSTLFGLLHGTTYELFSLDLLSLCQATRVAA